MKLSMKLLLCGMLVVGSMPVIKASALKKAPLEPENWNSAEEMIKAVEDPKNSLDEKTKALYYVVYQEFARTIGQDEADKKVKVFADKIAQNMDERFTDFSLKNSNELDKNNISEKMTPVLEKLEEVRALPSFQQLLGKIAKTKESTSIPTDAEIKGASINKDVKNFFAKLYAQLAFQIRNNRTPSLKDMLIMATPQNCKPEPFDTVLKDLDDLDKKAPDKSIKSIKSNFSGINFTTAQGLITSLFALENKFAPEDRYIVLDLYLGLNPAQKATTVTHKLGSTLEEVFKKVELQRDETSDADKKHKELKSTYPFDKIIAAVKTSVANKEPFMNNLIVEWAEAAAENKELGTMFKLLDNIISSEPQSEETKGEVEDLTKDLEDLTQALFALIPPKK